MYNNYNKFQQYIRQNPILLGVFIFIQITFVILLAILINRFANTETFEESNLPISNLEKDLQDLPENSVSTIQVALYDAVAENHGTLSDIEKNDAKVRDGTMVNLYFERQNMHYINFIVDIPSVQQSYQIFNEWSDNPVNKYYMTNKVTMAMCLPEDEIIYQNFSCEDNFDHKGQNIITAEFLKYFSFEYFTPTLKNSDPSIININPVNANVDDDSKQLFIQETKDAISSLGISPEVFQYHIVSQDELDYVIPIEYR